MDMIRDAVPVAEAPFQDIRRAILYFDIHGDEASGHRALESAASGIEELSNELEHFSRTANVVARQVLNSVR